MLTYLLPFVSTLCVHSRRMAVLRGCFQDQLEKSEQAQAHLFRVGVGKLLAEFIAIDVLEFMDCGK